VDDEKPRIQSSMAMNWSQKSARSSTISQLRNPGLVWLSIYLLIQRGAIVTKLVVAMLLEQEEEETVEAKFRILARPGNNGGRGRLCEEEKMKRSAA
jgi:hypothetical protein